MNGDHGVLLERIDNLSNRFDEHLKVFDEYRKENQQAHQSILDKVDCLSGIKERLNLHQALIIALFAGFVGIVGVIFNIIKI